MHQVRKHLFTRKANFCLLFRHLYFYHQGSQYWFGNKIGYNQPIFSGRVQALSLASKLVISIRCAASFQEKHTQVYDDTEKRGG